MKDQVQRSFPPFNQLMLIVLLFFAGLLVMLAAAGALLKPLFGVSMTEDMSWMFDHDEKWVLQANRTVLFLQHICLFWLPALMFQWLYKRRMGMPRFLFARASGKEMIHLIVLWVGAMGLIALSAWWNSTWPLPGDWIQQDRQSQELLTALIHSGGVWTLTVNALLIAVVPAIGEELVFRGVLQNIIAQWTRNKWIAVIITALLFSLFHFQMTGFLPRFLLGAILGWLYFVSGNLLLPVLFHFLHNFCSLLIERYGSGTAWYAALEAEDPSGTTLWVMVTLSLLFAVAVWWRYRGWSSVWRGE